MKYLKFALALLLVSCSEDDTSDTLKTEDLLIKSISINGELSEEFFYNSENLIQSRKKYKDNSLEKTITYSQIGDTIFVSETPVVFGWQKFVHLDENRVQSFNQGNKDSFRVYYYGSNCGLDSIQRITTQNIFGTGKDTTIVEHLETNIYFDGNCSFESTISKTYLDGKNHYLHGSRKLIYPKESRGNIISQISKIKAEYNSTYTFEYNENDYPIKMVKTQNGTQDSYTFEYY